METKNVQQNTFSDGLNTDLHELVTPNTVLTDCVNGTLITYQGNEYVLQNDQGNISLDKSYLPVDYVPVGFKEHNGIIYIVSHNPITNKSQIGTYPSPEYTSVSSSNNQTVETLDITINTIDLTSNNIVEDIFANYSGAYVDWLTSKQSNYTEESSLEDPEQTCYAQTYYKDQQKDIYLTDTTENNYLNPGDQIQINVNEDNDNSSANELLTPEFPFQKRNYYTISKASYTNSINNLIQQSTSGTITLNSNGYLKCKSEVVDAQSDINIELVSYPTEYYIVPGTENEKKVYGKLNAAITANITLTQDSFLFRDSNNNYIEVPITNTNILLACKTTTFTDEDEEPELAYKIISNAQKIGNTYSFSETHLVELNINTEKIKIEVIPYLLYNNYLLYFDTGYYSWYVEKSWEYTERTEGVYNNLTLFKYKFNGSPKPSSITIQYNDSNSDQIGSLIPKLYSLSWNQNDENGDTILTLGKSISATEVAQEEQKKYYEASFTCSSTQDSWNKTKLSTSVSGTIDKKPFPGIGNETNNNTPPVLIPDDSFIIDDSEIVKLPIIRDDINIFKPSAILENSYFRENISIFRLETEEGVVIYSELVYPIWNTTYVDNIDNYNDQNLSNLLTSMGANNWVLSCGLNLSTDSNKIYGYTRIENGIENSKETQFSEKFIKTDNLISNGIGECSMSLWEKGICNTINESVNHGTYIKDDNNSWLQVEPINDLNYTLSNDMILSKIDEPIRLNQRHYLLEIFPFEISKQSSVIDDTSRDILNKFIQANVKNNINKIDVIRAKNTGGLGTLYNIYRDQWELTIDTNGSYKWNKHTVETLRENVDRGEKLQEVLKQQSSLENFILWTANDTKVSNQIYFSTNGESNKYVMTEYTAILFPFYDESDIDYNIIGLYPRSYNTLPVSFDCKKQDSLNLLTYLGTSIYRIQHGPEVLDTQYIWKKSEANTIQIEKTDATKMNMTITLYSKKINENELDKLINNSNSTLQLEFSAPFILNVKENTFSSEWIDKTIKNQLDQLDEDKLKDKNHIEYTNNNFNHINDLLIYNDKTEKWYFNKSKLNKDPNSLWKIFDLHRIAVGESVTDTIFQFENWKIDIQQWHLARIGSADNNKQSQYFSYIPIYNKTLPVFNQKIEPDNICLSVLNNESIISMQGVNDF